MNSQSSSEILDHAAIQQLFEADAANETHGTFLMETVELFKSSAPRTLKELKDALAAKNAARLCEKAHYLKSSCNIVGLTRMRAICHRLEFLADVNLDENSVSTLLTVLEAEFHMGVAVLELEIAGIR